MTNSDDGEANKVSHCPFGKVAFVQRPTHRSTSMTNMTFLPLSRTDRDTVYLELYCQNVDQNIIFLPLIISWSEEIRRRDTDTVLALA